MASDPRVSFGATTYEAASTASIVNGRILGATDQNALFYDLNGTRHEVSGMSVLLIRHYLLHLLILFRIK